MGPVLPWLRLWLCLTGPPDQVPDPPPPTLEPATEGDDDVADDEDLEEEGPAPEDEDEDEGVREIVVDASILGNASALEVFTHAGGRTVVDKDEMRERGATSVGEALQRKPGVRTVEGNSGQGSQDTKLQVAVRGVNPRLSQRATVLLDEIPIAPAPYGQPSLSLFPLSVFSIADIDVVRGGATSRYGPQTSGGVFNLMSNPIPEHPSVSVFASGDSNHDFSLGTAYGATHGRFGMYLEYAPRFGSSYREHSDKMVHGGLAKFAWQFNPRVRLESLTHGYFEDSELPGGLSRDDFEDDPFQSTRPFDWFRGRRVGTALKLDVRFDEDQDLKISTWFNHSYRSVKLASGSGDDPSLIEDFLTQPRTYDVFGVEPRWTRRFEHEVLSHQLSVGVRIAYEFAHLEGITDDLQDPLQSIDVEARAGAYAGYVGEKLIFLDGSLTVDAGFRFEYIQLRRLDKLTDAIVNRDYWAPLPAASLWYEPVDQVALFVAYGRSYGPATYTQLQNAGDDGLLDPELSNSVELGLKVLELGGIYGESTVWYKGFNNYIDLGITTFDQIDHIHLWGVESEISWAAADIWDDIGEPELYVGYGWTGSRVIGLTYTGNIMPWYPVHEAWAGASYGFDFGTTVGADFSYIGKQYTDFENRETETISASGGPIPAYTTVNLWARTVAPLPRGWRLEFTGGIKNIGDTRYFSRTDDRNAGLLVGRPRTYYVNVGFAHDFLSKSQRRARNKRRMRAAGRTTRRTTGRSLL